jgi:hypothetical protein
MDRDIRKGNQVVFRKMLELAFQSYKRHVSAMRPLVDSRHPDVFYRSDAKTKMLRFERERHMLFENSQLVGRLSEVELGSRYHKLYKHDYRPAKSFNSKLRRYEKDRIEL